MTTKTLTATDIGTALARKPNSAECHELVRACEPRREELRARFPEITPSDTPFSTPDPPLVVAAVIPGPEALLELEREGELVLVELLMLDRLEMLCHTAEVEARLEELRAEFPKATRASPQLDDAVRDAFANLAAAIDAANLNEAIVGEFQKLGPEAYPRDDAELAARRPDERKSKLTSRRITPFFGTTAGSTAPSTTMAVSRRAR